MTAHVRGDSLGCTGEGGSSAPALMEKPLTHSEFNVPSVALMATTVVFKIFREVMEINPFTGETTSALTELETTLVHEESEYPVNVRV